MKKIQPNSNIASKFLNGIVTKVNAIIDKLIVDVKVNGESVVIVNEDGEREADIDLSLADQNVKQSPTTDNKDYRVLLSKSDNDIEETDIARKNTNLKYNPSTGNLQATKLNGNTIPSGSGNDTLAKTSDIPDMTNYIQKSLTVGLIKNDGTIDQSDYVESSDLADVAFSGSYNDLIDTPTIPAGQIQSDWEQDDNTEVDYIKNKPTLATVATSGSYNDLTDTPTIPTVNNATLTIQKNGTNVQTFTANASSNKTANIIVPTALADLTDDATHRVVTDTEKSAWDAKANISDITNAINDLDVTGASNIGAGKTIKAWSETDGKVSITTQNISITKSQISDFPTIPTVNDGKLTINQNGNLIGEFTANDSDNVTVNLTDTTYTASGVVSIDANNNITSTAEVNQNTFAKVKVGTTTITADAKQDTLELYAGDNVTLTPDATNDKVTISATDTTYTASGVVSIDANNNITSTAEVNQNAFSNVKVGSTTIAADSKTDTLELVQGTRITLTPDATNDKVTIATTAEVNQNAFSNVKVGDTTIEADTKTDTLELVAGTNVTLTPNATNDSITIAATDTNTHRPIQLNGTQILGNNTTALNLKAGDNMTLSNSSGTVTFTATDTNNCKSFFGTCDTAAATAAKVVTLANADGWELKAGVMIGVKFSITNTASSVTLNVNGSGAKKIYFGNAEYTGNTGSITGAQNYVIYYMFDGTYWCFMNISNNWRDTNTWTANDATHAGYVASPNSTANKVWKTNSSGVPQWLDDKDTTYTGEGLITVNSTTHVISTQATANTGTVTKVSTGAGLTGGDITGTGTIKCKLKSETASTLATASRGSTTGREYPVGLDKNSVLSVNVPWENTTYTGTGLISVNSSTHVISTSATDNTGTVTKVSTGAGLVGGDVTTTGTIKCDLKSETKSTLVATSKGSTASREYAVGLDKNGDLSVNIPWTDTTYTFTGGTNKFSVSVNGGTASDVTITPSISNNITGSGTRTSGYIAKFSGTNTITNGPQIGSDTTKYLRNDGTWEVPSGSVTGVKGNAESSYRTGQVILTPANVGALALSGGRLTGNLYNKGSMSNIDATQTDNGGVEEGTMWQATAEAQDKNNRRITRLESAAYINGDISFGMNIRKYYMDGDTVKTRATKGLKMTMNNAGTLTYTVDNPENFRSAIGLNWTLFGSVNCKTGQTLMNDTYTEIFMDIGSAGGRYYTFYIPISAITFTSDSGLGYVVGYYKSASANGSITFRLWHNSGKVKIRCTEVIANGSSVDQDDAYFNIYYR